jgi:transcriptional regulator with XRE-family HTH domain
MSMQYLPSSPAFSTQFPFRKLWGGLFGEEIQAIRQEKDLSLEEVARRAGITPAAWQAVEAGTVPQSWVQLCAMAEGLGESRLVLASLVIRYSGAWDHGNDQDLPGEIRRMYS